MASRPRGNVSTAGQLLRSLAILSTLHLAGLLLFTRGFLLTRVELGEVSGCGDTGGGGVGPAGAAGCWSKPPFRKAVLLLLDGLRWDVASGAARSAVASRNLTLSSLASLAGAGCPSLLARFVADPPTTTQQRLKGLLTGGLPTFVDVGSSFGAPALREDNLLAQLRSRGARVALLGDDTWVQLFPDSRAFSHLHPFPSFNVQDLHTVDSGIKKLLQPLLARPGEWDVLIAHFLGVDHAGHTFGMDSVEMSAKLAEMDQVITSTAAALAADAAHSETLFIVCGDHGMTWAGDHGGATDEEVHSALFAMPAHPSGRAAYASSVAPAHAQPFELPQVDFAPSLALLLGLPVPYGSMGRLSRRMWMLGRRDAGGEGEGEGEDGGFGEALLANAWQVRRALRAYRSAGAFAADDVACMEALYDAAARQQGAEQARALDSFLGAAAQLARAEWTQFHVPSMAAGLLVLAAALAGHVRALLGAARGRGPAEEEEEEGKGGGWALLALLSCAVALAHALGDFSVGFMKEEQAVAHAPMAALSLAHAVTALWRGSPSRLAALALPAVTAAIYAASMAGEDKPSPLAAACSGAAQRSRALCARSLSAALLCTFLPLLLLPAVLLSHMGGRGGAAGRLLRAATWAGHAAVGARWTLSDGPLTRLTLPRLVYALCGAAMAATLVASAAAGARGGTADAVAHAARGALAAGCAPLLLLTGRRAPLLALLAWAQAWLLMRCHTGHASMRCAAAAPAEAAISTRAPSTPGRSPWRLLSLASAMHCGAAQLFSATGHRSSFDALHFAAAFTGFDTFQFARQGALLAANTWAAELLAVAALPLAAAHAGGDLWHSLRVLALARAALRAADALAAAAAAAALRRHLHVWSHFAPHYVFQAINLLLTDALTLAVVAAAAAASAQRKDKAHAA